ncbi:MAG: L7Ae/L30e/S12e/Gadd45 family ribosomal protein [Clostridium fessum]
MLNLLGLATRAGKTASGEFMTEKAIKSGKAYLVIVSEEASDNHKKMFEQLCAYLQGPRVFSSARRKSWDTRWAKRCAHLLAVLDCGLAKALVRETVR